jgi:hypothetical protein
MTSIDYKQKYLKYKNKYIELKALEELTQLNEQTGGFAYTPGEYVFFIPESKANFDSQTPIYFGQKKFVDSNGNILGLSGLDDLTNYLGNCTKFLRVGKTSSGFDLANTYNTLYSNQSTGTVIKRESNDAWVAAKPYVDSAINTTKQVAEKTWDVAKQGVSNIGVTVNEISNQVSNQVSEQIKKANAKPDTKPDTSDSTIHMSDVASTDTEQNKVGGSGADEECIKVPQKISKDLLIGTQNEVTEDKLMKIVKFIKDNKLQGTDPNNKISRIIYVKKPLVPGKPTTIDMARNFVVNYNGDNIVSISKK